MRPKPLAAGTLRLQSMPANSAKAGLKLGVALRRIQHLALRMTFI